LGIPRARYAFPLAWSGWSWGCVSTVDREGRTIFVADAYRDNEKRFVARSDEKLTAFLELEPAIRAAGRTEDCEECKIKLDKLSRIK